MPKSCTVKIAAWKQFREKKLKKSLCQPLLQGYKVPKTAESSGQVCTRKKHVQIFQYDVFSRLGDCRRQIGRHLEHIASVETPAKALVTVQMKGQKHSVSNVIWSLQINVRAFLYKLDRSGTLYHASSVCVGSTKMYTLCSSLQRGRPNIYKLSLRLGAVAEGLKEKILICAQISTSNPCL